MAATTSSIRTSRRTPVKLTPTSGVDENLNARFGWKSSGSST